MAGCSVISVAAGPLRRQPQEHWSFARRWILSRVAALQPSGSAPCGPAGTRGGKPSGTLCRRSWPHGALAHRESVYYLQCSTVESCQFHTPNFPGTGLEVAMQNTPDTPYFAYLYVFTCEQCYYPYVETLIVPKAPKDEIDRQAAGWTCTNCKSHQYTAGYQTAVYA